MTPEQFLAMVGAEQLREIRDISGQAWFIVTKNRDLLVSHNRFLFRERAVLGTAEASEIPGGLHKCDLCAASIEGQSHVTLLDFGPPYSADNWALCNSCGTKMHNASDKSAKLREPYQKVVETQMRAAGGYLEREMN